MQASQVTLQPPNRDGSRTVALNLGFQTRYIGKIHGETFSCKRASKHIHRKTNSLGLNYALLTDLRIPFTWVAIDFEGRKLVTRRAYWIAQGQVFQFTEAGFELQSFLPLSEFGIEKARAFENAQGDLFDD